MEWVVYGLVSSHNKNMLIVPVCYMANSNNSPDKLNMFSYNPKKVADLFQFVVAKTIFWGDKCTAITINTINASTLMRRIVA